MKTKPCPNAGPGRYEGNRHPCLAAAFDAATEYASESFGDDGAGIDVMDFFSGPFASPADLPDAKAEPCPTCASAFPFKGALLDSDGYGFRSLMLYGDAASYDAALAKARAKGDADP